MCVCVFVSYYIHVFVYTLVVVLVHVNVLTNYKIISSQSYVTSEYPSAIAHQLLYIHLSHPYGE